MEYVKIFLDEEKQNVGFFTYRDLSLGKMGSRIEKAFPLDILAEHETHIYELIKDDIVGIYFEQRRDGSIVANKINWDDSTEPLEDDQQTYLINLCKEICVDNKYDSLNAPPTVEQQVEDFIKEFFENDEEEPLEQKDFLAEFFAELEEDEKND